MTVIEVRGNRVTLGFSGPRDVRILRGEIAGGGGQQAVGAGESELTAASR